MSILFQVLFQKSTCKSSIFKVMYETLLACCLNLVYLQPHVSYKYVSYKKFTVLHRVVFIYKPMSNYGSPPFEKFMLRLSRSFVVIFKSFGAGFRSFQVVLARFRSFQLV